MWSKVTTDITNHSAVQLITNWDAILQKQGFTAQQVYAQSSHEAHRVTYFLSPEFLPIASTLMSEACSKPSDEVIKSLEVIIGARALQEAD